VKIISITGLGSSPLKAVSAGAKNAVRAISEGIFSFFVASEVLLLNGS
jgi:hypothetical protein